MAAANDDHERVGGESTPVPGARSTQAAGDPRGAAELCDAVGERLRHRLADEPDPQQGRERDNAGPHPTLPGFEEY